MKTAMIDYFRNGRLLDISPREYHELGRNFKRGDGRKVMSRGELVEFSRNPRRWKRGIKDKGNASTEWGNLIDCLLLTPELFEKTYAIAPETYPEEAMKCPMCGSVTDSSKCAKCKVQRVAYQNEKPWNWNATYCSNWRDDRLQEGKEVVKSDWASSGWEAVHVLKENEDIAYILEHCETQMIATCDYYDEATGLVIPLKIMPDIVPEPGSKFGDTIMDLKTTESASPRAWRKHVEMFGLDVQAAIYVDVLNSVTGLDYTKFAHLIQESFEPYDVSTRNMSDDYLNLGRAKYRRALADYCYCLKENWWPGYDEYRHPELKGWGVTEPEPWMLMEDV